MAPCAFGEHTARLRGAATTKAGKRLRSARDGFIGLQLPAAPRAGALTECLHRRIAGSSGRPPRLRVVVLSLPRGCAPHGTPSRERPANATGPSHPAPAPATKPARLSAGAGRPNKYSYWHGRSSYLFSENQKNCYGLCHWLLFTGFHTRTKCVCWSGNPPARGIA